MDARARPWRHGHPTRVSDQERLYGASRQAGIARGRSCGGILVVIRGGVRLSVRGHHQPTHHHRRLPPRRLGAAAGGHHRLTRLLACLLAYPGHPGQPQSVLGEAMP